MIKVGKTKKNVEETIFSGIFSMREKRERKTKRVRVKEREKEVTENDA